MDKFTQLAMDFIRTKIHIPVDMYLHVTLQSTREIPIENPPLLFLRVKQGGFSLAKTANA